MRNRSWLARQQLAHVILQPGEQRCIPDQAVLDDLAHTTRQLTAGKAVQRGCVHQHTTGLVESANHVLASRMINTRLAADRGVDLRHDGRWHLCVVFERVGG